MSINTTPRPLIGHCDECGEGGIVYHWPEAGGCFHSLQDCAAHQWSPWPTPAADQRTDVWFHIPGICDVCDRHFVAKRGDDWCPDCEQDLAAYQDRMAGCDE